MSELGETPLDVRENLDLSWEIKSGGAFIYDLLMDPMTLPFGTITTRPSVLVVLDGESGDSTGYGYGEGVSLDQPLFTDDFRGNLVKNSRELITAAVNEGSERLLDTVEIISDYGFKDGGRYPTARLAVEVAAIDSATKTNGYSMKSDILGLADVKTVPYGHSLGANDRTIIVRGAEDRIRHGADKIKLKISPENSQLVIAAIKELQDEHPDLDLMVDANGSFDPQNILHQRILREIDELGLYMIEEPVSRVGRIVGLNAVKLLKDEGVIEATRVGLDDCLKEAEDYDRVIDEDLASIVNIKPGRIGSFIGSIELAHRLQGHEIESMVGGMFEATPGRTVTTLLAAYCLRYAGATLSGDISLAQERLYQDLVDVHDQMKLENGEVVLPDGYGWGYRVTRV